MLEARQLSVYPSSWAHGGSDQGRSFLYLGGTGLIENAINKRAGVCPCLEP